ncbi:MAG: cardiolipin synthase [Muribaculaceae bacterium]|nr:cardiolipin synthase [Muribaculaceae bacterium]
MVLAEIFPYAHVLYNVLMVLYVLTIVGTIVVILSENRNPVKSLAWATVLILMPLAGIILYAFFGRNFRNRKRIPRKRWRKLHPGHGRVHDDSLKGDQVLQARLASTLAETPCYEGNSIDVYTDGQSKFDALMRDIQAATSFIYIQYYIIENDNLGKALAQALVEKVKQGVSVRLIYDHVGSYSINSAFFSRLRKEGIEAHPFLKVTFTTFAARLNWRNHRKVVVIDGTVGYVGGMNVADRYVTGDKHGAPWRDTHLRITGPAVVALHNSFAVDWYYMKRNLLTLPYNTVAPPVTGDYKVQIVASGPTDKWNSMYYVVLQAIARAKKSLYIQTPYFLPSESLLNALQVAALSGVDVRLMIPRRTDSAVLRYASGSYIKECLLAGIKIYVYDDAMLHSKVIIVDDDFVTTGSSNFDFRSFEHNFECNALVYSNEFNRHMKSIFIDDQHRCTRLILSHWRRRRITTKAMESVARLLAPIL